ncbi:class I SAM-dependent methyltransferase [bacterium]
MKSNKQSPKQVFDQWALDDHADGMERSHWTSVKQAFELIPESQGNYLEIGFGNGYGIHYMATHQYRQGQCYGLDVSPNMVEKTSKRLQELKNISLQAGDFLTWSPSEHIQFSCIFSMEVFYYFHDIHAGINKAISLLSPEGLLVVMVNYYLENKVSHSWPEDLGTPMTLWSEEQYLDAFQQAGLLNVKQIRFEEGDGLGTLCTYGIKAS